MNYVKPDIDYRASPHDAADWIEFQILSQTNGSLKISRLSRMIENQPDRGELDDSELEDVVGKWLDEILLRKKTLGEAYPFDTDNRSVFLKSSRDENKPGCYAYLLCLLLSHAKNTDVLDGETFLAIGRNDIVRKYFQGISTIAAGGYIQGNSISFGFPREDGTNFIDALQKAITLSKDGALLLDTPHDAANKNVKDYEIDVLSWIPTNDDLPGKIFLVSQVASGYDWPSKRIRPSILTALSPWVHPPFASHTKIATALFMPFCVDYPKESSLAGKLHVLVNSDLENIIFYRYRVPYYVQKAFEIGLDTNENIVLDETEQMAPMFDWVDNKLNELRA